MFAKVRKLFTTDPLFITFMETITDLESVNLGLRHRMKAHRILVRSLRIRRMKRKLMILEARRDFILDELAREFVTAEINLRHND